MTNDDRGPTRASDFPPERLVAGEGDHIEAISAHIHRHVRSGDTSSWKTM